MAILMQPPRTAAEATTSGEIVCVVTNEAAPYAHVHGATLRAISSGSFMPTVIC